MVNVEEAYMQLIEMALETQDPTDPGMPPPKEPAEAEGICCT